MTIILKKLSIEWQKKTKTIIGESYVEGRVWVTRKIYTFCNILERLILESYYPESDTLLKFYETSGTN